jgi:hypothetical protein
MHIDQQPYRQLYDDILDYDGDALFDDLLRPWLAANDGERRWLESVRDRRGDPVPSMAQEELWRLYALSRIVELLQLSFAPRTGDGTRNIATVTADEHARFMTELGMEPIDRAAFHPFYHEVVAVDAADDDAPPEIVEVFWPGWRLGPLLISRAGCRVRAGRRHLVKEIAEQSTLYWAFARSHRPTDDPSRGWGGNSQWRTAFRRDYALDGALHFNVDGRESPGGVDPELDEADRMELLRHRCFVTSPRRHDDRWPYGFRLVEREAAAQAS